MSDSNITRRQFLKQTAAWTLRVAAAGAVGSLYGTAIEPSWVDVVPVSLILPRLSPSFHGYRLAQISDIHLGDWLNRSQLEEVVRRINGESPDAIVITGDFITRQPERSAADLVSALSGLRARDGVVAVLGNHDYRPTAGIIREVLWSSGIQELGNAVHTLQRGDALLHLAGVDDVWQEQARIELVLGRLPAEGAAVLLAHEPDFADTSAATGRFSLQVSGHSHGGQVVVPFIGPPQLPPLGRKYPLGLYRVGDMLQYTNRGIGMVKPHVRFNCRPEITLFTFLSPQA